MNSTSSNARVSGVSLTEEDGTGSAAQAMQSLRGPVGAIAGGGTAAQAVIMVRAIRGGRSGFGIEAVLDLASRAMVGGGAMAGGGSLLPRHKTGTEFMGGTEAVRRAMAGEGNGGGNGDEQPAGSGGHEQQEKAGHRTRSGCSGSDGPVPAGLMTISSA